MKEIIRHLEARQLLPPLVVLQELARNRSLPLGVVRDYVARQLAAEVSHRTGKYRCYCRRSECTGLR